MLGVINIPMLNAEIVTGISLMLVFIAVGNFLTQFGYTIQFGFWTVLIGHVTFNLPYVVMSILPKLKQGKHEHLRGGPWIWALPPMRAFFTVVLPDIMPGVLSGFSFWLSLCPWMILLSPTL